MVCPACGAAITGDVRFCARCGGKVNELPVSAPPLYGGPPPQMPMVAPGAGLRVQRNLQTMGILWCVYAGYRVVSGLVGMFFLRTFAMGHMGGFPFGGDFGGGWPMGMAGLVPFIGVMAVIASVLAAAVGYSLLTRQPWGRVLAIIAAILALVKFPLGTALGIYTLWVLAPAVSGEEYDALADRS